jgi:phage tail protein X
MMLGFFGSAPSTAPVASANFKLEEAGRFYQETGKTLAGEFVGFYDKYGGVLQFGYPVTEAQMEEVGGGKRYLVQWTERQRLEYHPEQMGTPYEVLLGLLGRELTSGLNGPRFQPSSESTAISNFKFQISNSGYFFPETGQRVAEPFLSYWRENGGLPIYGYPISTAYTEESGLLVQWFERARFEYHPEYHGHTVLLGHLGLESRKTLNVSNYELEIFGGAAPDSKLKIDLSQGGESEDPHFLDNVKDAGRQLGPGLVRLDNIYNFYGIVSRRGDRSIGYNWERFDVALDGVRAMGKEPLICLSYMPETMSVTGDTRVAPPASYDEWAALVQATVAHVNRDRKLGVKYWEVWNEPDQWGFWHGSYPEYLKLYDVTVEAALSADPGVRIGGPGTSRFSTDHLEVFLAHEAEVIANCKLQTANCGGGRVDFLSWHEYGQTPESLAEHIREARATLAKYPEFSAELFITEFNVLQGGAGDTSANGSTDRVQGAIALLTSIESMQRERLDRAFLFELKDGQGPRSFWGRWGILTNDGQAKPIYQVYKAYQNRPAGMLPVSLRKGPADGSLGMMAYGSPARATFFLWYTGEERARVKVSLPASFAGAEFNLTLFDEEHNNPAVSGDATLRPWMLRDAGDLVLDLKPGSLVIMETVP